MKPVKNALSTTAEADDAHVVPRAGQLIGDRYRLDRPLERGAMGSVWRAEQVRLRAPVAVKFLDPSLIGEQEMHDRFIQEARSAAAVRSAHVVQVFDYGSEDGVPYIAMELLDGENLDARLGRGPLSPAELARLFSELARGIGQAHAIGVIHRDLKPGNIFIAREGEHEVTKIVDFGIAKVKASALRMTRGIGTQLGTLLGTPQYMSPEQVRGSVSIDHRTDLWALGVIACECLTGQCPFSGATIGDLTVQICTERPPAPSTLGPVPHGFDPWFFKAVQRKPQKRFQSAEEMSARLLEVLAPALAGAHVARSGRLISLPNRSEVRLAYGAVLTYKGQLAIRLGQLWAALRSSIVQLGLALGPALERRVQQVRAGLARARVVAGQRPWPRASAATLAALRLILERHAPLVSVALLCCGMLLLGLSSRSADPGVSVRPLRADPAPVMPRAVAAPADRALPEAAAAPAAATAQPEAAPAERGAMAPGAASAVHAEAAAKPAPAAGVAASRRVGPPSSPEPASPASAPPAAVKKPITMAMAQAAAKILTADELVASLPASRAPAAKASVEPAAKASVEPAAKASVEPAAKASVEPAAKVDPPAPKAATPTAAPPKRARPAKPAKTNPFDDRL